MNRIFGFFILFVLFCGCQQKDKLSNHDIYSYLELCFENYYKEYNVNITPLLNNFENTLINEGYLNDTSATSYQQLFQELDAHTYFKAPLEKDNFNRIVLLKNPSDVLQCATAVYSIDSARIAQLPFSQLQQKINNHLTTNDSISLHYFFNVYAYEMADKEYNEPYVKQTILLFLYRWYYQSKLHQKEIELKNHGK